VWIENKTVPFTPAPTGDVGTAADSMPLFESLCFCIPHNDKHVQYCDVVADRLFKIRNCMNIEGVVRELPLFEPPIDPALLVRARAMGLDLATVLDELSAPSPSLPVYLHAEEGPRVLRGAQARRWSPAIRICPQALAMRTWRSGKSPILNMLNGQLLVELPVLVFRRHGDHVLVGAALPLGLEPFAREGCWRALEARRC
jgi:hypothetical protein